MIKGNIKKLTKARKERACEPECKAYSIELTGLRLAPRTIPHSAGFYFSQFISFQLPPKLTANVACTFLIRFSIISWMIIRNPDKLQLRRRHP